MNKKNPANNLLRCLKLQVGSEVDRMQKQINSLPKCPAKMSLVPLSFFDSSDSMVLQVLQTKPSVLFWSSQVRKEVQMFRRRLS